MKALFFLLAAALFSLPSQSFSPLQVSVSGKITDASGKPLAGATVRVFQEHLVVKTTTSNADGAYSLADLSGESCDLAFSLAGHETRRILDVPLDKGKPLSLDLFLHTATLADETVIVNFSAVGMYASPGGRTVSKVTSDAITSAPASSGAGAGAARSMSGKAKPERRAEASRTETARPVSPLVGKASKSGAARKAEAPRGAPVEDEAIMSIESGSVRDYETAPSAKESELNPYRGSIFLSKKLDGDGKPVPATTMPIADDRADYDKAPADAPAPPSGPATTPAPHAGLLTAGEWNDLHNWAKHWTDLLADGEIDLYQTMYQFYPRQRYAVLVTNEQGFPVVDATVRLQSASGGMLWEARTDNMGKAELWAGMFDKKEMEGLKAEVAIDGQTRTFEGLKTFKGSYNFLKINRECQSPKNVDIVWAVDATGSMGDEIEYLKTELLDVIGRVKAQNAALSVRMGTVFYRDEGDEYLAKSSGLSPDIARTVQYIRQQFAGGGGDYPEAVHSALEEAIFNQPWSEQAVARICFLVLDASPHQEPEVIASLQRSIREAARKGIRIVPVTASGIQKDTEFLMKFFGLATNGTYVFLTDHSGIGGKHLEPTTDEYKVEALNDLLVRLITDYTTVETCEGKLAIRSEEPIVVIDPQQQQQQQQQNTPSWQATYYPNPASAQFTLELPEGVQTVTIYDAEGKAVRKLDTPVAGVQTVMVNDLSEGFYTIRILKDGQWRSGKLMVVRA